MSEWLESMPGIALRMALEKAAARTLALDPVAEQRLEQLSGKVLCVCTSAPDTELFIRFIGKELRILARYEDEADCRIAGTPLGLLQVARSETPVAALSQNNVTLEGDAALLEASVAVFREAEFDWEGLLARYTGGIAAHALGRTVNHGREIAGNLSGTALANLPEFLQEELRVLPAPGEVDMFREQLDELRLATDRLDARVQRLLSGRN